MIQTVEDNASVQTSVRVERSRDTVLRSHRPLDFARGERDAGNIQSKKRNGFSLVELMVVIFILGLLATIVAINVLPAQDTASVTSARANIKQLEQAIELYRLDTNRYPGTNEGLAALKTPPASLGANTRFPPGGYFRGDLPNDPWGNPYQYVTPGPNGLPYAVYSLGADGAPGGTELNADIYANE
ncbi:MAG: type II secretion system major pseudopilin GspG [Pseudomonadota bacterium]